jgi:hypothetical protein
LLVFEDNDAVEIDKLSARQFLTIVIAKVFAMISIKKYLKDLELSY